MPAAPFVPVAPLVAELPAAVEPTEDVEEAVVTTAVVAVVATCCGVNGSRPRPASFEAPRVLFTEIAGSAAPED